MTAATIAESTPLSNRVLGPVYHASRLSDGAHVLATPTGARYATVDNDGEAAWLENFQLCLCGNLALCESAEEEGRLVALLTEAVTTLEQSPEPTEAPVLPDPTVPHALAEALRTVAAKAAETPGLCAARLAKGLALALSGAVTLAADGHTATVASQTEDGRVYHVNGSCSCADHTRAPQGFCKHLWRVGCSSAPSKACPR